MEKPYLVEVIDDRTGELQHSVECATYADAERVERGMLTNMSDAFYTRIRKDGQGCAVARTKVVDDD